LHRFESQKLRLQLPGQSWVVVPELFQRSADGPYLGHPVRNHPDQTLRDDDYQVRPPVARLVSFSVQQLEQRMPIQKIETIEENDRSDRPLAKNTQRSRAVGLRGEQGVKEGPSEPGHRSHGSVHAATLEVSDVGKHDRVTGWKIGYQAGAAGHALRVRAEVDALPEQAAGLQLAPAARTRRQRGPYFRMNHSAFRVDSVPSRDKEAMPEAHAIPPKRPQVTLACQVFYPDAQSTSQLLTDLLERLSQTQEFDLTVLCGFPSALRAHDGPVTREETWNGIRVVRCGLRVDAKRSFFSRLLSYVSFLAHAGWKLLWSPRRSLILGVTNPPFMGILLWLVSRLRPLRYCYNLQDLHPDGLFVTGTMKPGSPASRLWVWLNGLAYRRAEKLLVLGRDMIPIVRQRYRVPEDRFVYVPHWSAAAPERALSFEESLAPELGLAGKFVVQYSGNMGLWHDMKTLVRAAASLRADDSIRFLFIGGGRARAAAEALAGELQATNIVWRDFVPRSQLDRSLACCHVSLVSMLAGLEGVAVPCKIFGTLASGRPVIAQVPARSEVAMMVEEENCGFVVEPGNPEAVVNAILRLKNDPDLAAQMGARGFAAYHAKYTLDKAVGTFRRLLHDATTSPTHC
jgi:colanic acid biosynthesis glycosyl transferase WcaI